MPANDFAPPDLASLVAAFAAGVGMLLGGAANLLLARAPRWTRVVASGVACAGAAGGAWLAADSGRAAGLAGGVAAAGLVLAGVGPALAAAAAAATRRPAARWGGVAAAGVVVALGAVAVYDRACEVQSDRTAADLAAVAVRPPTHPADAYPATDRGTPVAVTEADDPRARAELDALEAKLLASGAGAHVIRRQHGDDRTNCHGWVFTGGRFWVSGTEVDRILADNAYRAVADPRPGDLAVYRQAGAVAHTAVVRYVSPGMPVLVEGKWGATGVYLHAAGDSIYGPDFTYYRADRAGHVLAGLDTTANAGGQ